jgi:hypothetical protein
MINFLRQKKLDSTYGICDLFDWFYIITRDQLVISIEKFNAGLFESTLSQKETLDTGKAYPRKSLKNFRLLKRTANIHGDYRKPAQ